MSEQIELSESMENVPDDIEASMKAGGGIDRDSSPIHAARDEADRMNVETYLAYLHPTTDLSAFGIQPGGTVDATAFAAALSAADGKVLHVQPGTYIFTTQITTSANVHIYSEGGVIFKLADGAIVNTDTSTTNYKSILQVRGCSRFVIEGIIFDGNRDGQTYPATANVFGRGSRPFRHNGIVEFVPGGDNATRSSNVVIRGCTFKNGYMNGLVFWQGGHAKVVDSRFEDNTWNGCAACGMIDGFDFEDNRGRRNGVSAIFDVSRQTGDRATLQIREYDNPFTAATEGIPTIPSTTAQFSYGVQITGNRAVEDQVEGIFVRGAFDVTIARNRVVNVGYQRTAGLIDGVTANGEVFFPSAIWVEWGTFRIVDNDVYQPHNNTTSGWMQPDGIVAFAFEGDGTGSIDMDGVYPALISRNRVYCGQDYLATGSYVDNTQKKNNLYRGVRVNGNALLDGNIIEGTSAEPILALNDGNWNADQIKRLTISGGTIRNFLGDGAIRIQRFGSPTGVGGEIKIEDTRIADGRSPTTGNTRAFVLFDTNLDGKQLDNISIQGNIWDCLNSADTALNYYGVRHRGSSQAKVLNISGNTIKNALRAFRISTGETVSVVNNTIQDTSRFVEINLTGNIAALNVTGNTAMGITFAVVDFAFGGATITRFVFTQNVCQGSGVLVLNGLDWSKFTTAIVNPNIINMGSAQDLRRSFAGSPTVNAHYVGEIVTSTSPAAAYIAKSVGSGATDWSLLA